MRLVTEGRETVMAMNLYAHVIELWRIAQKKNVSVVEAFAEQLKTELELCNHKADSPIASIEFYGMCMRAANKALANEPNENVFRICFDMVVVKLIDDEPRFAADFQKIYTRPPQRPAPQPARVKYRVH
jgi:hypothetical protein